MGWRGRVEKVLKHINKSGRGIEIGPCHNPIAPKSEGFNVDIIDHLDQDGLKEKYRGHSIDFDKIEPVDFIWSGQKFTELTGKSQSYDWVIASHVIEHTPDLIGFIHDCASLLKDDGVISLVIPDKRYCFDHFRSLTPISSVIDSHLQERKMHTCGGVIDFELNTVSKSGLAAWNASYVGKYVLSSDMQKAKGKMQLARENQTYIDIHAWCFVPHSFRLMIQDLFELGFIDVKEVDFYETDGCEFYMTLGRHGDKPRLDRLDTLKQIELELKEKVRPDRSLRSLFLMFGNRVLNNFPRLKAAVVRLIKN